jgi:hypothetical protein
MKGCEASSDTKGFGSLIARQVPRFKGDNKLIERAPDGVREDSQSLDLP